MVTGGILIVVGITLASHIEINRLNKRCFTDHVLFEWNGGGGLPCLNIASITSGCGMLFFIFRFFEKLPAMFFRLCSSLGFGPCRPIVEQLLVSLGHFYLEGVA